MTANGFRAAVAAVCVLGFAAGDARAAFVVGLTGTATPEADGYRYAYTLTNDSTAGELVTGFAVTVPTAADISTITTPPLWEAIYSAGDTTVEWVVTPAGPGGLGNALPPGGSADGFSFFSRIRPAAADFTAAGDAGGSLVAAAGSTVGPTAVPEPSAVVLGLIGLGVVGLRRGRRVVAGGA